MSTLFTDTEVRVLNTYSPDIAMGIGALMPQLDPSFSDTPMSADYFERHFAGADRSILVATTAKKVIGSAVMSTMVEQATEAETGYMGGFVVDKAARGSGAATALWDLMKLWCQERGLGSFMFNTETFRPDAIRFYQRMGAQLIEGTDSHYQVAIEEPRGFERAHAAAVSFFGNSEVHLHKLGEGLVNSTFLAEVLGERYVLQRLNPVFDESMVEDSAEIVARVQVAGFEVPEPIRTTSGELSTRDSFGALWRCMSYIESDTQRYFPVFRQGFEAAGALLGKWHASLAGCDYEPQFSLPHFHDTAYYCDKLRAQLDDLSGVETRKLARAVLGAYRGLPYLSLEEKQLIHGDPQLNNMLFRDGMPFTYIDLDTTMMGSPWLDVGDLLRSVLEADCLAERPLNPEGIRAIMDGYRTVAQPTVGADEFYRKALIATQRIALELAMRFLSDIVDDNYFDWDSTTFSSRRDNHMYRADIQWQIYQATAKWAGELS